MPSKRTTTRTPAAPEVSVGLTVEDIKDVVREALEDDVEIFSADDDAEGNIVVEAIDDTASRFKVTVEKLADG